MRIGLLQCDHVIPELKPRFGDYYDFFSRLFKNYSSKIVLDIFDIQHGIFPKNHDAYAGFISTGSGSSVYDNKPWIKNFKAYVQKLDQQKIKFIGICFGHQMIAEALGGKCNKTNKGWGIGVKEVVIHQKQKWMKPELDSYRLLFSHQDQITQLPKDGMVIGGNDHCPYSMITVGDHFLGIQAHPEFTPAYTDRLMQIRIDRIGLDTIQEAEKTLRHETDESIITSWMINFLEK
jgi:GMP synthase-like glutamine amidotransferase